MIKKLLEKWSCSHDWEVHYEIQSYTSDSDKMPHKIRQTLICQKCGKIKRITL